MAAWDQSVVAIHFLLRTYSLRYAVFQHTNFSHFVGGTLITNSCACGMRSRQRQSMGIRLAERADRC
jgi:hypothetical protein